MPYRVSPNGTDPDTVSIEILLVTSRGTGRWVVPKGNLGKREAGHDAAAREALEEAGVTGVVDPAPIGGFRYDKQRLSGATISTTVAVYALAVTAEHDEWPESAQRVRRWFSPADAADAVDEPDLGTLIRAFRPG